MSTDRFPVRKKIRMPRAVYRQEHVFFVTSGTHNRYPWFRVHPGLADFAVDVLSDVASTRKTTLYAWCIMPDHVHLLVQDNDITELIRLFKGRMNPQARLKKAGQRLWQRSFYDHALREEESLYQVALYIWENPVRAEMVGDPSDYAWSGSGVWPQWREFYKS